MRTAGHAIGFAGWMLLFAWFWITRRDSYPAGYLLLGALLLIAVSSSLEGAS